MIHADRARFAYDLSIRATKALSSVKSPPLAHFKAMSPGQLERAIGSLVEFLDNRAERELQEMTDTQRAIEELVLRRNAQRSRDLAERREHAAKIARARAARRVGDDRRVRVERGQAIHPMAVGYGEHDHLLDVG